MNLGRRYCSLLHNIGIQGRGVAMRNPLMNSSQAPYLSCRPTLTSCRPLHICFVQPHNSTIFSGGVAKWPTMVQTRPICALAPHRQLLHNVYYNVVQLLRNFNYKCRTILSLFFSESYTFSQSSTLRIHIRLSCFFRSARSHIVLFILCWSSQQFH